MRLKYDHDQKKLDHYGKLMLAILQHVSNVDSVLVQKFLAPIFILHEWRLKLMEPSHLNLFGSEKNKKMYWQGIQLRTSSS